MDRFINKHSIRTARNHHIRLPHRWSFADISEWVTQFHSHIYGAMSHWTITEHDRVFGPLRDHVAPSIGKLTDLHSDVLKEISGVAILADIVGSKHNVINFLRTTSLSDDDETSVFFRYSIILNAVKGITHSLMQLGPSWEAANCAAI
jgi:hypothetical protein